MFPFITAPTHFCNTAEHFNFYRESSWEDRRGFSLDVLGCILTKDFLENIISHTENTGHVKVTLLGNPHTFLCIAKKVRSLNKEKGFHCKCQFCCLVFAYFTLTQGFFAWWDLLQCSGLEAEAEMPLSVPIPWFPLPVLTLLQVNLAG